MKRRGFFGGLMASVIGIVAGVRTVLPSSKYQSWGEMWTPEGVTQWYGDKSWFDAYPKLTLDPLPFRMDGPHADVDEPLKIALSAYGVENSITFKPFNDGDGVGIITVPSSVSGYVALDTGAESILVNEEGRFRWIKMR